MPRPHRHDFPGALHHVTNRGLSQRPIFETVRDVRYFLSRLLRAVRRGEILLHAYSLLTTHFHLLVSSPDGRLSTAMRRIQCEYSKYFNRTRSRRGGLYDGRYFSRVVDSTTYLDNVVRYIDGNAVHAGLVARPEWHCSGSVHWYMRDAIPLWLSADLLRARAAAKCGATVCTPGIYRRAFAPRLSPSFEEWIQKRLARGETAPDPHRDLIDAAPTALLAWMQRNAQLADRSNIGAPMAPWEDVLAVVETEGQEILWTDGDGRRASTDRVLCAGLLRHVSGLSYSRVATIVGCSHTAARYRCLLHDRRLLEDERYAIAVGDLAYRILRRIG